MIECQIKVSKKSLPCLVASGLVSTWNRFKAYLKLCLTAGMNWNVAQHHLNN